MPCRVSSDAHEWINENPAVLAWYPVNPRKVDEQSTNSQREKKTPWSFTAACCWDVAAFAERSREPFESSSSGDWSRRQWNTDLLQPCLLPVRKHRDNSRWAVRLGRHPLEKISRGPKDRLRRDRNPL